MWRPNSVSDRKEERLWRNWTFCAIRKFWPIMATWGLCPGFSKSTFEVHVSGMLHFWGQPWLIWRHSLLKSGLFSHDHEFQPGTSGRCSQCSTCVTRPKSYTSITTSGCSSLRMKPSNQISFTPPAKAPRQDPSITNSRFMQHCVVMPQGDYKTCMHVLDMT